MTFDEVLAQVQELLRREGRVAYRVLKRRFGIDDEYIEDLKADLIDAKRLATDENGKVFVWVGNSGPESSVQHLASEEQGAKSREHGATHEEEGRGTTTGPVWLP